MKILLGLYKYLKFLNLINYSKMEGQIIPLNKVIPLLIFTFKNMKACIQRNKIIIMLKNKLSRNVYLFMFLNKW